MANELENGIIRAETKKQLLTITNKMIKDEQLDGVVLGCTELPLILDQADFDDLKVLDIAKIQIAAAVDQILSQKIKESHYG